MDYTRQGIESRGRATWGERFDPSSLDPRFDEYYRTGQRIIVKSFDLTLRGYVGVTTGWRPSYLLLLRADSTGSPYILGPRDEIIGTVNRYRDRY